MNWLPLIMVLLASPAPQADSFAITNVTVEVGDGTRLSDATVVVRQGLIAAVGAKVKAPAGLPRIDGQGKVLAPGFIESWSVLGLREVSGVASTRDYRLEGQISVPGFRAIDGFNPLSVRIPIAREEGVTSAVTAPWGALLYGTGGWFELTGKLDVEPVPVAMFGGVDEAAAAALGNARGGVWLKLREIVDDVRYYRKSQKACDQGKCRDLALSRLHLTALFPVLDGKLPLVLVAHRASDIRTAVRFAKENAIRLVIAGASEAWIVADDLAGAKVPVIMAPEQLGPGKFETLRARDDAPALLARAGVPLVISAGGWITRVRQEAGIAVAHGLDHAAAIKAITLAPAEAFGKASELGSVENGKRANLVLWSGDPLELSTIAEKVWIDGVEQSLDNRQRMLSRRYLEKR